jgi:hypothetical protein
MKIKILTTLSFLVLTFSLFGNSITQNQNLNSSGEFNFIKCFSNENQDKPKKSDPKELSPEDLIKIDNTLKIVHAAFAGVTYASLWALDAVGAVLLYYAFTNQDSNNYQGLKYAHIAIAASALLSFATIVTLAFTKIGIKVKNKLSVRTTHLTAAFITLGFYVLELTTIILSAVYFNTDSLKQDAKWVGLAHGVTCGLTTLSFSVSLITVFF